MSNKKKLLGRPTSIYLHDEIRSRLVEARRHYEDTLGVPISTSWLINKLLADSLQHAASDIY